MTVASGGAGDITLGTAVDGYQTFADAGVLDTNVVRYTIEDGDDWEIGTGVYTASGTTLVRTVTESSNSDAALTCSGNAIIFVTLSAADLSGNPVPRWTTTPAATLDMSGGDSKTITGVAVDEGGFPIQYSWDGFSGSTVYSPTSLPPQLASAPTINQSNGVVSLTASSIAGSFVFRLRASDGVNTLTSNTTTTVTSLYTTGLLGQYDISDSSSYSGSGTTWSDISGNSGPDLTLSSNVDYISSSIGGKPSLWVHGIHPVVTTSSLGGDTTVVVILSGAYLDSSDQSSRGDRSYWFAKSATGTDYAVAFQDYSTIANTNLTGHPDALYVNKVDYINGSYGAIRNIVYEHNLSGADSSAAVPFKANPKGYHSVVASGLNLSGGFSLGPVGFLRAILFYDHEPSAANVTAIHNFYKSEYASDSDMAP
jgi:hypothetical protein